MSCRPPFVARRSTSGLNIALRAHTQTLLLGPSVGHNGTDRHDESGWHGMRGAEGAKPARIWTPYTWRASFWTKSAEAAKIRLPAHLNSQRRHRLARRA